MDAPHHSSMSNEPRRHNPPAPIQVNAEIQNVSSANISIHRSGTIFSMAASLYCSESSMSESSGEHEHSLDEHGQGLLDMEFLSGQIHDD